MGRRSVIYRSFQEIDGTYWKCKVCLVKVKSTNPSNLYHHIKSSKHVRLLQKSGDSGPPPKTEKPDEDNKEEEEVAESIQAECSAWNEDLSDSEEDSTTTWGLVDPIKTSAGEDRQEKITDMIVYMLAVDKLPCSTIKQRGFRLLIKTLAPDYQIPSVAELKKRLKVKYDILRQKAADKLAKTSYFSVTVDTCSDLNASSYIGITVHFVVDSKKESVFLSLIPYTEELSADELGEEMLKVFSDFDIPVEKIVSLTTDHTENICQAVTETFGQQRHIECLAYLLDQCVTAATANTQIEFQPLSVVAGLKGENGDPFYQFEPLDTHWTSTYEQLEMYKKYYPFDWNRAEVDHQDEDRLNECLSVLKPFYQATMETDQQPLIMGSKYIPIVALLRVQLEVESEGSLFQEAALSELNNRFRNLEGNITLACATLLDPRYKRDFFKATDTLLAAERCLKKELISLYKPPTTDKPSRESGSGLFANRHLFSGPTENGVGLQIVPPAVSIEYDTYISEPTLVEEINPLVYWTQEGRFPHLKILASKYLSVMGTSVTADRLFSKANNVITLPRKRLNKETLTKFLFISQCPQEDFELDTVKV